jgi:hypothetical protein
MAKLIADENVKWKKAIEFAGLDRQVMLIGQGNKFELWDEARWSERRDQWLAAETPELDEAVWQRAHMLVASAAPDLSPLLRSDAAISVSVEVFQSVYRMESVAAELKAVEGLLHESFVRDVLPLWYERRAPLRGTDARRVSAFRDILREYQGQLVKVRTVLQEFQQAVARL